MANWSKRENGAALAVIAATLVAAAVLERAIARDVDARFRASAAAAMATLDARLGAYGDALAHARASLVPGERGFDATRFSRYLDDAGILARHPGMRGIGLVARGAGETFPIVSLDPPDERNRRAVGLDMGLEPTRRATMERARDDGAPRATPRIVLLSERDHRPQAAFLFFLPVYAGGKPPATLEARRAALVGFIYGASPAADFFPAVFGERGAHDARVDLSIYDGPELSNETLLYSSAPTPAHPSQGASPFERLLMGFSPAHAATLTHAVEMPVAGRAWTLVFRSRPDFHSPFEYAGPTFLLGMGALAAAITRSHLRGRRRLLEEERAAARAVYEKSRKERLLVAAGPLLASKVEVEEFLAEIARLSVPTFADWCVVDLVEHDGRLRRVATAHADPAMVEKARAASEEHPLRGSASHCRSRVVREGEPLLVSELAARLARPGARDDGYLEHPLTLGVCSYIGVPLKARDDALGGDELFGVVSFLLGEGERRFDDGDLACAVELAHRATLNMENARLLRRSRESLAVLEALVGEAPMGFAFLDADLRYRHINSYLASLHGSTRDAMVGRTPRETSPHVGSWLEERYRHVIASGRAFRDTEISGESPLEPGVTRHWLVSHFPVHVAELGVIGVGVVSYDLTERKRAEEAARRQQALTRLVTDALPALVAYVGNDGRYVFVNSAYEGMHGRKPEELLGMHLSEFLRPDVYAQVEPRMRAALRGEKADFETRFADGTRTHVRYVPDVGPEGDVRGFVSLATDVTEQRRTEERFRLQALVLENMNEGVSLSDEAGVIVYTNPAEDRIFGYPPGGLVGRHVSEQNTYPPMENLRIVRGVMDEILRLGEWVGDFSNVRADGTAFVTRSRITRLDLDGRPHFVCVQEDVTESKRAQAEREKLYEEARAANTLKDEFLATLSHELRTPLSVVLGHAELLTIFAPGGVDWRRSVEAIERNARAQLHLVEELLDASRIMTGKFTLARIPLDPAALVADVASSMALEASERGIEARLATSELPLVHGDPDRLRQALMNLYSNALKFTPRGGTITLRARTIGGPDGGSVELTVTDTGKGIDAAFLPHVFDRFRQEDSSSTRRYGGLGLGLAITRAIIEGHGGTAEALSEGLGKGTTFRVSIPVGGGEPGWIPFLGIPDDPARREASRRLGDSLRDLLVLVVDDDPDGRELVGMMLEMHGARPTLAATASEARERLHSSRFDLLVSDVGMPEEDGLTLVRSLRLSENERVARLPMVALTAFASEPDRRKALEAGFDDHLSKPVEATRLVAAVSSLVGRARRS